MDDARKLFGMPGAEHVEPSQSVDQMLAADRTGRVRVGLVLAAARPHHRAAAEGRNETLGDARTGTVEDAALAVDLLGVREPAEVRPVEPVTEPPVAAGEMTKLVSDDGACLVLAEQRQQRHAERQHAASPDEAQQSACLARAGIDLIIQPHVHPRADVELRLQVVEGGVQLGEVSFRSMLLPLSR